MNVTDAAYSRMLNMFDKYGHSPSKYQLVALKAVQECLTSMMSGKAGRHYYLSSLDPGMGKTTAIVCWINAYMGMYQGHDCPEGVLICVDRLEEISRYIRECNLHHDSYAVVAGKKEIVLNSFGLGHSGLNKALVVFTTKEQIRRRSQGISIDDHEIYHFKGKPRAIKVWDESLSLGRDIVINPYEIGRLFYPLSFCSEDIINNLQALMNDIMFCEAGKPYQIPILPELPHNIYEVTRWKSEDRDLLELLWRISGQWISVRKDRGAQLIIDCVQSIPSDFPPCLILDASGRIKGTYRMQEDRLDNLIRLPYSNKSYRNLDVKVWGRAAGKGLTKDLKTVTPELVKIIKEHQREDFLFLLYKDQENDVKESLRLLLPQEDLQRFHFVTWGKHTATNAYCDVANVIALSAYQYPDPTYDAMTRAAGLLSTAEGQFPTQAEINMVKKGEISSDFLQGVTRGKSRKSDDDTCPPCRLWLIAHPATGLGKELPVIFPDCKVSEWETQGFTLTKTQQKAIDLIKGYLTGKVKEFPSAPIRNELGMRADNYKRMLMTKQFQAALKTLGLTTILKTGGMYFQTVTG
jgi:hypothetical protein